MRRVLKRLILTVLVIVLLLFVLKLWLRNDVLSAGAPLPPGTVQPQLVSAWDTAVLIAPDGSLWAWGGTEHPIDYILKTTKRTPIPQRVGTNSDWRKVAATMSHMLALKSDGSLWSWGQAPGLVRPETNRAPGIPQRVGTDTDWAEIAVGAAHRMALKNDGSLWTWGQNRYGQLGNNTTNETAAPARISEQRWRSIAAGAFNGFALQDNGTIWSWGLDIAGGRSTNHDWAPRQIDANTNWVALSASSYCLLALKEDGSLWLRGQNARFWTDPPSPVATDVFARIGAESNWKVIHCGEQHLIGRDGNGTWWALGLNHDGQFGLGADDDVLQINSPRRLPYDFDPWAMALGTDRGTTLVLLKDGTLWSCGLRVGEKKSSGWFDNAKRIVNKYTQRLPGRPFFAIRQLETDTVPREIWNLPPDVVGALREPKTNRLSK